MVPGAGIEPATRGFSVRCSTTELPGRNGSCYLEEKSAYVQNSFLFHLVLCALENTIRLSLLIIFVRCGMN